MKLKLSNVRLAFPKLFVPGKMAGSEGEPTYGASFLIHPDDVQLATINKTIDATATEKWGVKAAAIIKGLRATDKVALHDGDLKSQYTGFAGMMYVATNSATRPLVLDKDKTPLTQADGKPYGGCYVNATVEFWAQDNSFGKRVNAQLLGVQFFADGDSFGGGSVGSADDFDDLAVEDETDLV